MISQLAAAMSQERARRTSSLLALVGEYIVAEQRYCGQATVRKRDIADREYCRIEQRIASLRARTTEGMRAKARCAFAYAKADEIDEIEGGSCADTMARSIFADLQQLNRA